MKKLYTLFAAVALCALCGCATTLEPGGAYAPHDPPNAVDKAFFHTDASFKLVYGALDGAFTFERDNRAMLWKISPDIKHTLDKIRPQAWQLARQYALARQAFLEQPTERNLDALYTVLGQLRQLNAAVTAVLPKE